MVKICPSCHQSFDCRNDNILECWCLEVNIPPDLREYLASNFKGCLCRECIEIINKNIIHINLPKISIENENH